MNPSEDWPPPYRFGHRVREPRRVVDHDADLDGVGKGPVVAEHVVLVWVVENRRGHLETDGPEILGPFGLPYGLVGVFMRNAHHHRRFSVGRLHHGTGQREKLVVSQHWAVATGRRDF